MSLVKEQQKKAFSALKETFGYRNVMQSPKITKVVISTGTGSIKDKNKIKVIEDRLAKITGHKASPRKAKKAIASFKSRLGDTVGYQVTLRGDYMYHFLDTLVHVALPRMRDFRGLKGSIVDDMGNCTISVKEHTIFPETADEDIKDVFGLAVTIVTSIRDKKEAVAFLQQLGFPFEREKVSENRP